MPGGIQTILPLNWVIYSKKWKLAFQTWILLCLQCFVVFERHQHDPADLRQHLKISKINSKKERDKAVCLSETKAGV